jgi:hypothetical protein
MKNKNQINTYNIIYTTAALTANRKLGFTRANSSTQNPISRGLIISAIADNTIKKAMRITLFLNGITLLIYLLNKSRSEYLLLYSFDINPAWSPILAHPSLFC